MKRWLHLLRTTAHTQTTSNMDLLQVLLPIRITSNFMYTAARHQHALHELAERKDTAASD